MKKDLFDFSDFDDSIVENIAEKYSDMDKSEQKALCGKVRKRLDMTENSTYADTVSGVEPAKKPILRYIFGTAAAAVFALAVIPLAFKALKNAPDAPENIQESQIITDYNASPTENEEADSSAETVTTKIGESDIIAEITAPQPPTYETTAVLPTSPEKSEENENEDNPPISEGKKTTKAANGTTPRVTTKPAKTTTKAVTAPPAPPTPPAVSEDGIFNTLANLSYSPYTCDGIADYILTAEDGTTYQILTGCKHVWRNSREEADITPEILEWVKKYGAPYKIKEYNATAEVDWCMNEFSGNVWNVINFGYSAVITNTDELREYLAKIYPETKVNAYLEQYSDSYFQNNVLALNAVIQSAGTENKLEITSLNVSDREIKVTGEWHWNEVEAEVLSICLAKVEIPKNLYVEQPIYWGIPDENYNYYNIRMKEIEEYERQNICTMVRERAILNGEMSEDAPRLTLEQAEEIIRKNGSPESIWDSDYAYRIISTFNEICECPDVVGGSGITRYEYWLDNSGDEKIVVLLEQPAVWYYSKFGGQQLV